MSFTVTIELSDKDLEHFMEARDNARKNVQEKSEKEIVDAAANLLKNAQQTELPDFIGERLAKVDNFVAMLRDVAWCLGDEDRERVISALAYFADPKDIIPDSVPVLGYLDDAIMVELCVRDLEHELQSYDDFCFFRQREAEHRGIEPATVGQADWLEARRLELQERMHTRRSRGTGTGYGSSSGYAQSKSFLGRSWRPGELFGVR